MNSFSIETSTLYFHTYTNVVLAISNEMTPVQIYFLGV